MWNIEIISMVKCRKNIFVKFTTSLSTEGNCQLKLLSLYYKIFQYNCMTSLNQIVQLEPFVFVKCGIACLIRMKIVLRGHISHYNLK